MKISYLLGSIGRTGGNVVIFHHIQALYEAQNEVYVVSPFGKEKWDENALDKYLNTSNTGYTGIWRWLKKVQYFLKKNFGFLEKNIKNFYLKRPKKYANWITNKLIENWEPADITIATHSLTVNAANVLAKKTNVYYHMQGFEPWFVEDEEYKKISLDSYHFPIKKIANSSWLKEKVFSISNDPDISLVFPGLNHSIFYNKHDLLNKYNNPKIIKITSYADSRPLKGWKESIEAMEYVFDYFKNKEVKIEWSVFGSITNWNTDLPINYKGFLSHTQLSELYNQSHIVFIPSWFESFPLQPIEAMACGTTILTTKIGTEDYSRHLETAFVIEPKNIELLREGLIKLIENPNLMLDLSKAGLIEAQKYNWENSKNQLFDALGL
ncbi:glycosyltransferase family 4 protein [Flavobacterium croceum]|uniref:glycosyltransferase family 4 protein n=1 Tax=Flavobacterium croceum TaxID=370975 RepID=UPI0024A97AA3|nr:glycosyltransferase family 4 protein [Flavobacterium croceum]